MKGQTLTSYAKGQLMINLSNNSPRNLLKTRTGYPDGSLCLSQPPQRGGGCLVPYRQVRRHRASAWTQVLPAGALAIGDSDEAGGVCGGCGGLSYYRSKHKSCSQVSNGKTPDYTNRFKMISAWKFCEEDVHQFIQDQPRRERSSRSGPKKQPHSSDGRALPCFATGSRLPRMQLGSMLARFKLPGPALHRSPAQSRPPFGRSQQAQHEAQVRTFPHRSEWESHLPATP